MILPANLVNDIRQGRVILFLGAGASKNSFNSKGQEPPNGTQLSQMLSDRFLGSKYASEPLAFVAELAISESNLSAVQDFIREVFIDYKPADFHLLLPTFCWRGIVTTNYDLVVEQAYNSCKNKAQRIVSFVSNKDRVDDLLKSRDDLPFLKIHGCITRTSDPDIPLILTPDQYITHRNGRSRLFDMAEGWGYEYPIVFIGHGLQDSDVRYMLLKLAKMESFRPRYYLIKPLASDEEVRLWESKRISVLNGGFKDFLMALDSEIKPESRKCKLLFQIRIPLRRDFHVPRI